MKRKAVVHLIGLDHAVGEHRADASTTMMITPQTETSECPIFTGPRGTPEEHNRTTGRDGQQHQGRRRAAAAAWRSQCDGYRNVRGKQKGRKKDKYQGITPRKTRFTKLFRPSRSCSCTRCAQGRRPASRRSHQRSRLCMLRVAGALACCAQPAASGCRPAAMRSAAAATSA